MKQSSKNEAVLLELINKIQELLLALDKKIDTLINRPVPQARPFQNPPVDNNRQQPVSPNDRNTARVMHTAICADCKKECTIPFKPSGERLVYCKDCFSRRKVISMSRMGIDDKPPLIIPEPTVKPKKKAINPKKPIAKKKPAQKKE